MGRAVGVTVLVIGTVGAAVGATGRDGNVGLTVAVG